MKLCFSLLLYVAVVYGSCANAATSLYEITKGDHKLYLGGTIHLLRNQDFPLPTEFEQAYERAQIVVLEVDLEKARTPQYSQKLAQSMMYTNGDNLSKVLSPAVWKELQDYSAEHKFPIEQMIQFKPIFVSVMMTVTEAQRLGMGHGVDVYFDGKARAANKPLAELESGDDVIASMQKVADTKPDLLISSTLSDLKKLNQMMGAIVAHWRTGNLKALDKELAGPMRDETPEVYRALVVDRNQQWLPKITQMLTTDEIELVLVGSLHLSGKDGLLQQLKKKGYKVKPYQLKK